MQNTVKLEQEKIKDLKQDYENVAGQICTTRLWWKYTQQWAIGTF